MTSTTHTVSTEATDQTNSHRFGQFETFTDLVCPRCTGLIPNSATPGKYPGALSRKDNATEVCSRCGTEEGLAQFVGQDPWPTFPQPLASIDLGTYEALDEHDGLPAHLRGDAA